MSGHTIIKWIGAFILLGRGMMECTTPVIPRIGVVGAGLAGLTVAYRLVKSGYDVALYEARAHRVAGTGIFG